LNIANFISGKDLGGSKQSFLLYSEAINSLEYNLVSIIKKGAKIKSALDTLNLRVLEIEYFRLNFSFIRNNAISRIRKALNPLKLDIIFIHKPIDVMLTRMALGDELKIISVIHSFDYKYLEYSDEIIAVSNNLKEFLIKNGIKNKIHIVPNMIKSNKPFEYKDIPSIPTIGSMGVFRKTKGFHNLIKAFHILKQDKIPFNALIAGKGKLLIYYKFLIYLYSLNDNVKLLDWVSGAKRDDFFNKLDLYVLSSNKETFGMVIIEALSRSVRVIATKCGGSEDIITDNHNGLLTSSKTPQDIATKIKEVINCDILSSHIPKNGYEYVMQNYDIFVVKKQINNLIKGII